MRLFAAALAATVLLASGCIPHVFYDRDTDAEAAEANVRSAVPAIEAWNADNGTYAGMTPERLRESYDAGIGDVRVAFARATDYCVESAVGDETYSMHGPAGEIVPGGC